MTTNRKSRPRYRPRRTEADTAPASRPGRPAKSDAVKSDAVKSPVSRDRAPVEPAPPVERVPLTKRDLVSKVLAGLLLVAAFAWAYGPTLVQLVEMWDREPDYSHGFLVLPLALGFLWVRRDSYPGLAAGFAWPGLLLIALSGLLRFGGAAIYLDALDGLSIVIWVAGAVWLVCGTAVVRWSLSSILFLVFMVPLPFKAEGALSQPLQAIATKLSCWSLQSFGQPALAEGNTIWLGDVQMQVAEACSGLRIFMGVIALACAFLIVTRKPWWMKALLIAATVPIALLANASRIVVTGLLWRLVSGEAAHKFSHDFAGWLMIPLAAAMFGFVLWYLGRLFPETETLNLGSVLRRDREDVVSHSNEAVSASAGAGVTQ